MTLADAIARLERMRERRLEKAQAYSDVAAEYEARAISADEVLHSHQRDFLIELGMAAQRSAKTMREDAEALALVLEQLAASPFDALVDALPETIEAFR